MSEEGAWNWHRSQQEVTVMGGGGKWDLRTTGKEWSTALSLNPWTARRTRNILKKTMEDVYHYVNTDMKQFHLVWMPGLSSLTASFKCSHSFQTACTIPQVLGGGEGSFETFLFYSTSTSEKTQRFCSGVLITCPCNWGGGAHWFAPPQCQ